MDDQIETNEAITYPEKKLGGSTGSINWAVISIGLIGLLIGLVIGYMGRGVLGPEATAARGTQTAAAVAMQTRSAANQEVMKMVIAQARHFRGDPNAPVTLIEFSDFQCPYCSAWNNDAGMKIEQQYVESGKVQVGYFHFPFLGQESLDAAQAAECAGEQGKFWEFHNSLFSNQNGENQGAYSKDNLKALAAKMGLDTEAFNSCLDVGKYTDIIAQQVQLARQLGVQSTPSFLINGTPIVGAQPFENFKEVIDPMLK
jgi:protein-disulfide isomerase